MLCQPREIPAPSSAAPPRIGANWKLALFPFALTRCTLHACLLTRTFGYTSLPEPLLCIFQHVEHPAEERRNPREEGQAR